MDTIVIVEGVSVADVAAVAEALAEEPGPIEVEDFGALFPGLSDRFSLPVDVAVQFSRLWGAMDDRRMERLRSGRWERFATPLARLAAGLAVAAERERPSAIAFTLNNRTYILDCAPRPDLERALAAMWADHDAHQGTAGEFRWDGDRGRWHDPHRPLDRFRPPARRLPPSEDDPRGDKALVSLRLSTARALDPFVGFLEAARPIMPPYRLHLHDADRDGSAGGDWEFQDLPDLSRSVAMLRDLAGPDGSAARLALAGCLALAPAEDRSFTLTVRRHRYAGWLKLVLPGDPDPGAIAARCLDAAEVVAAWDGWERWPEFMAREIANGPTTPPNGTYRWDAALARWV